MADAKRAPARTPETTVAVACAMSSDRLAPVFNSVKYLMASALT